MPDAYQKVRSLPFPIVVNALGIDLTKFKTRKGGTEWFGSCPICQPLKNTTAFSINSEGLWNCFSGGHKGRGSIDLVMAIKGIGFKEACELLGQIQPTKEVIVQPGTDSESTEGVLKPFAGKYEKYAVPCPWLEERIPDKAIRERYGTFCYNNPARKSAYSGRVMLPVKDVQGVLYGYLGRDISDTPSAKYLFPPNLPKSRFLFGAHEVDTFGQLPLRVVYLVESPFCVMKFASLGIPAVSSFGWSVSENQIELLVSLTKGVLYIPDRNKTQSAQETAATLATRLWLRFPPLPAGIDDPEHLSLAQIQAL